MKTVTVTNIRGERERITLPNAHYESAAKGTQEFSGIWITGLFSGPKTGRKFVQTYSQWQKGNSGMCVGTTYCELSESEYLNYCEQVGIEPQHVTATIA